MFIFFGESSVPFCLQSGHRSSVKEEFIRAEEPCLNYKKCILIRRNLIMETQSLGFSVGFIGATCNMRMHTMKVNKLLGVSVSVSPTSV